MPYQGQILDSHVHYAFPVSREALAEMQAATGTPVLNIVVIQMRDLPNGTPAALAYKYQHPQNYVFTGLDFSAYTNTSANVGEKQVQFVRRMLAAGCDGVKMIEAKPDRRLELPIPDFDSPVWTPFWQYAQDTQVPIIWHVNDPETFWDESAAPQFAKDRGWLYGPEYINNEAQYRQIYALLEQYPNLNIIFAHFFFMSAQLERLAALFEKHPNVRVDLAPGIELYQNLSDNLAEAKAFFTRWQDRIVFGSDMGMTTLPGSENPHIDITESRNRTAIVRDFLFEKGDFTVKNDGGALISEEDFTLHGLGLPEDILDKIFRTNFLAAVGGPPKPVDKTLLAEECRAILAQEAARAKQEPCYKPKTDSALDVLACIGSAP